MSNESPATDEKPFEVTEGTVIAGKYRVEGELGRGAMGVVLAASDVESGARLAVKLMLPDNAGHKEATGRFMREARAASEIKSEHVVRVSDVGMLDNGQGYMAMERLEGHDLRAQLDTRGKLPLAEAAGYLLQALEALAQAHAAGIIHRDLKPGNLFITHRPGSAPVLKVLDFGISKVMTGARVPNDPLTHTSALLGSPMYMSPEQMKASKTLDARSDLWSIGVIFYELLTGEAPFQGESLPEVCAQIVLESDPPRASEKVPGLPPEVDQVIARCLERKLERRYASALELAEALAPFAPSRGKRSVDRIRTTLAPNAPAAAPGPAGARGSMLLGGAVVVLVVVVLLWRMLG